MNSKRPTQSIDSNARSSNARSSNDRSSNDRSSNDPANAQIAPRSANSTATPQFVSTRRTRASSLFTTRVSFPRSRPPASISSRAQHRDHELADFDRASFERACSAGGAAIAGSIAFVTRPSAARSRVAVPRPGVQRPGVQQPAVPRPNGFPARPGDALRRPGLRARLWIRKLLGRDGLAAVSMTFILAVLLFL